MEIHFVSRLATWGWKYGDGYAYQCWRNNYTQKCYEYVWADAQSLLDNVVDRCRKLEWQSLLDLKELLRNMIKYDPNERFDINDVIASDWYQEHCVLSQKGNK